MRSMSGSSLQFLRVVVHELAEREHRHAVCGEPHLRLVAHALADVGAVDRQPRALPRPAVRPLGCVAVGTSLAVGKLVPLLGGHVAEPSGRGVPAERAVGAGRRVLLLGRLRFVRGDELAVLHSGSPFLGGLLVWNPRRLFRQFRLLVRVERGLTGTPTCVPGRIELFSSLHGCEIPTSQ